MGDFNDIVPKRLNLVSARKATLAEAQNSPIPFDKYYALIPTRDIKKIFTYLILPPYLVIAGTVKYGGQLLFQYNVTASAPFYILNPIVEAPLTGLFLTVKWRVGTIVHRYLILGSQRYDNGTSIVDLHTFPIYNNQLVPINCVFEFWGNLTFFGTPGLLNGLAVKTNWIQDPTDVDETEIDVDEAAPKTMAQLGYNLPFNLPQAQPLIVSTSN